MPDTRLPASTAFVAGMADSTALVAGLAELAVVRRSGLIESRHFGSLLAINAAGSTVLELGQPDATVLPRSTAKPFQALACLMAGAPLEGPELAIAAGSHTGREEHVTVVRRILAHAGLDESALGCPVDWPEDEPTRDAMIRDGGRRERIRMNCSGKHAAMLLASVVNGWPTDTYLAPEHPLQRRVRETSEELTGVKVQHISVDGCGAPLFGTTVRGLATAFRKMVQATQGEPAHAVAAAMREHPFYVGGRPHANTDLMRLVPGALAKGGAEGVIAACSANGAAVAMKVIDGSPRATTLIALRVLEWLGTDIAAAQDLVVVPVLGGGVPVGEVTTGSALQETIGVGIEQQL